jgi:hypothetical protein
MFHLRLRTALTALTLAVASPALVACSDAQASEDVESTGTLNAALLSVGADGATYQFPSNARIRLQSGNFRDEFLLGGIEQVLNIRLPVGTFSVELVFPNGTQQLVRSTAGGSTLVDAVWTDPQPVTAVITPNATTSLVFHFRVSGLDDVSFDMGTLALALEVQRNGTAQPAQIWEQGTYTNTSQSFGASLSMEAQTFFAMTPGETHGFFFDFNIGGPWQQLAQNQVCTSGRVDVFTTEDGESGLTRATSTLIGQIGSFCITDRGPEDEIFINPGVQQPAPPDQQPFMPDNYGYELRFTGSMLDVYDGQTLQQSLLEVPRSIRGGLSHRIFNNTRGEVAVESHGNVLATLRLVP